MTKRNNGIDILRFLCAFFVVCIHAPFLGIAGSYIKAIDRIAVPVFFICSGYFLSVKSRDAYPCNNLVDCSCCTLGAVRGIEGWGD